MAGKRAPRRSGADASPATRRPRARQLCARRASLDAAVEQGRLSAVAAESQRALEREVATYRDAFEAKPFDATLLSLLAAVGAYSAPWLRARQLHTVNKASLWLFGVDWRIDRQAQSEAEVDDLVQRSLAVAAGAEPVPSDGLCQLLADIRDDLADAANHDGLAPMWRAALRDTLAAMAWEQRWRLAAAAADGPRPTIKEYLSNADNLGLAFVFLTLLIADGATPDAWRPGAGTLREAVTATQQLLRLINDVGTEGREAGWGDLNILSLGLARSQVDADIRRWTRRCLRLFAAVRGARPEWVSYLERVIGFNVGLYGVADYWGRP